MFKEKYIGYLQLAAAMSLAGSSVVVGKCISHLPIFFAQMISLLFALAVIIPAALIKEGRLNFREIAKKDYLLMLLQGLFGVLLFRVFMMIALKYASAASTGIALSTTPAVLYLFSLVFLKEKLRLKALIAVFLCFLGMSFLNVNLKSMSFSMDANFIMGNLFAFLSVCSEAMFTILRKKQTYSDRPLTSTAIVMFFAFILFLPIGAMSAPNSISLKDFGYMIIYGIMCSAAAYAFWFSGLAKVRIGEAAGFAGFMPLSSILLSVLVLGEKLIAGHIVGIILVLTGIYLIVLKKSGSICRLGKNE